MTFRKLWNNAAMRRVIKGTAVGLSAFSLIYLLEDPKLTKSSKKPPYITSSETRPIGGLSINGVRIDYLTAEESPLEIRLKDIPAQNNQYFIRFTRTQENPAEQVILKLRINDANATRVLYFHENETRELSYGGRVSLSAIDVVAGDHTYKLTVRDRNVK